MLVPTTDILALLRDNAVRDASPMFGEYVGYQEQNGRWFVLDESQLEIETQFLIEDCVASECYETASIIKKYEEEQKG